MVRILRDSIQPDIIRRVVRSGNRAGPRRDLDGSNGAPRGQIGSRRGALEVGEVRRGLRRGSRVGTGFGRTMSFEVELEEVEESAGDKRAQD